MHLLRILMRTTPASVSSDIVGEGQGIPKQLWRCEVSAPVESVQDSVGSSNPNLEGFLEDEVSVLRPVGTGGK